MVGMGILTGKSELIKQQIAARLFVLFFLTFVRPVG